MSNHYEFQIESFPHWNVSDFVDFQNIYSLENERFQNSIKFTAKAFQSSLISNLKPLKIMLLLKAHPQF